MKIRSAKTIGLTTQSDKKEKTGDSNQLKNEATPKSFMSRKLNEKTMKKQIKNISIIALLFTMSSFIISCQSKTDKFLDKYDKITKTLEEKVKKGEKLNSLVTMTDISADLAQLSDGKEMKLTEENMNEEQKARFIKISARYVDAMTKLQGVDTSKMMNNFLNEATKGMEKANEVMMKEMEKAK